MWIGTHKTLNCRIVDFICQPRSLNKNRVSNRKCFFCFSLFFVARISQYIYIVILLYQDPSIISFCRRHHSTILAKTMLNVSEVGCWGLKSVSSRLWRLTTNGFLRNSVSETDGWLHRGYIHFLNSLWFRIRWEVSHSLTQYKAKLQSRSLREYFWFMFGLKPHLCSAMQKNSRSFVSLLTQPVWLLFIPFKY